jgi:hypothetical protein
MQCYTYILNVKWRKKINNWGHNFQTNRKRKWNIIKLYKQKRKSIKFNAAYLPAYFWAHKVRSSGMHQVYSMCYKSFKSLEIWSIIGSTEEHQLVSLILGFASSKLVYWPDPGALYPCWGQQWTQGWGRHTHGQHCWHQLVALIPITLSQTIWTCIISFALSPWRTSYFLTSTLNYNNFTPSLVIGYFHD